MSLTFIDDFQFTIDNICRLTTPSIDSSKWRSLPSDKIDITLKTQADRKEFFGASNQNSTTPKFDRDSLETPKLKNRFSFLDDEGDVNNFDPHSLPVLDEPGQIAETKKPTTQRGGAPPKSTTQKSNVIVNRASFGISKDVIRGGLTKNRSSNNLGDPNRSFTSGISTSAHSQSTKQLPTLNNSSFTSDLDSSRVYTDSAGTSKSKLKSFLNASMPKDSQRKSTIIKNKSSLNTSYTSQSGQRHTISKNKSALDLSMNSERGKPPSTSTGLSFKLSSEEISKPKAVNSSMSLTKGSMSSRRTFQINPKFEAVVHGLRNETLEHVDLTGAGNVANFFPDEIMPIVF